MIELNVPELDYERMRTAGKELLSLALMDTRNRTLRWMVAIEEGLGQEGRFVATDLRGELDPPLWTLGFVAWFQEYSIARNAERRRGERADPKAPRTASALAVADRCFDPRPTTREERWRRVSRLPSTDQVRQYLVDSVETTLELLDAEPDEEDATLYFYRLAVLHEDRRSGEAFAVLAQTTGFAPDAGTTPAAAGVAGAALRAPIAMPATRWRLGFDGRGFAFADERAAHTMVLDDFEIDAQPVTWSQYAEFVADGGYDDPSHWSPGGWQWVMREGRRTPRHVDQMRHGVLQHRHGQVVRVPGNQPATHVSHHEAEAWCRWADRRLPGEAEWEAAASQGAPRGFRWGAVHEWTASTYRPYPGYVAGPAAAFASSDFEQAKVLRGASIATPHRLVGAKLRQAQPPESDIGFYGFRSCAL